MHTHVHAHTQTDAHTQTHSHKYPAHLMHSCFSLTHASIGNDQFQSEYTLEECRKLWELKLSIKGGAQMEMGKGWPIIQELSRVYWWPNVFTGGRLSYCCYWKHPLLPNKSTFFVAPIWQPQLARTASHVFSGGIRKGIAVTTLKAISKYNLSIYIYIYIY